MSNRITAGPRSAELWVVINAFDRNAHGPDGSVQPWRSRSLGRVRHALETAGWTNEEGKLKPVHLRALSTKSAGMNHHEARSLSPEKGLFPHDRAQLRHMIEKHQGEAGEAGETSSGPRVLVLVGEGALELVTGEKKTAKWAGSPIWVPDMNVWAIAIEDPFTWIMDHTKFHAAVRDLRKAVRIAEGEEPQIKRAEVTVLREFEEAMVALRLLGHGAVRGIPTACDIEAWGGIVRSVAWSTGDHSAVVLPLASIKGNALWAPDEEEEILSALRSAFSIPEAVWIFQNAIFDDTVMHDLLGVKIGGVVHDTMARHNVLYPDQPKNLGFQVRWYLPWDTYHKDDAKAWKPNTSATDEGLWKYNGVDADTTRRVYFAQESEPQEVFGGDYESAFREHLAGLPELYSAVREISLTGIRVDGEVLCAARAENQKAIGEFSAELAKLLGRPVWAVSPEKEAMRAELVDLVSLFGLREAFSKPDGSLGPMSPKRKQMLAMLLPALLPGQAGPILAGMLGAGIEPGECVQALATGRLPDGAFCFAQKGKVKELLYSAPANGGLGLKEQEKRRVKVTGETSTSVTSDTAALKKLLADIERMPEPDSRASRIIVCLLALASLIQLEKAYFSAEASKDGRFRGAYNIAGTTTRRFACNAWFDGTGFNLMTFPRGDFAYSIPGLSPEQAERLGKIAKALKLSILPDAPDHVIVNMDLAQAEARVVAYEARDPKMIYGFESGVDFHSYNAMNIWGYKDISQVPKHRRQQAKIAGHGSNYMMGPGALSRDMQVSYGQGKAAQDGYYRAYENVPLWHQAIRARLLKGLPILNAFGWPRISHDDPTDQGTLRALVAHGPQSTVPMLVNQGWLNFRREQEARASQEDCPPPLRARIMMQTHDSLTASVHKDDVDEYCAIIRSLMEISIPVTETMGPLRNGDRASYVIPCDFEVGPNYGDLERYLSAKDEKRVREELRANPSASDASIALWCGVSKDAVAAVRAGRGRAWWQGEWSGAQEDAPAEEGKSHVQV